MRIELQLVTLAMTVTLAGCAVTSPSGRPSAYHYQMGLSYLEERNFTAALTELTEAEKMEQNNPELQYNLGRALVGRRRLDLAEQKFLKALALRPKYSEARNDLGVLYLETGRWDNAIQQFKAVKDDLFYPQPEFAQINLGLAYLGKGDYPAAMAEFNAIQAINPRNPIVRVSIGRVLFAQGQTERAIAEYRRALEIAPEYANGHYQLGLALMKQSRLTEARESFKEVARIVPDSEIGRAAMGYVDLLR